VQNKYEHQYQAAVTGISSKTARKYLKSGKPSQKFWKKVKKTQRKK